MEEHNIDKRRYALTKNIKSLFGQILKNPLRYYGRMGAFTFGVTFASNVATSLFNNEYRKNLYQHNEFMTFSILMKSCYFGILWPAFYINCLLSPKNVFYSRVPNYIIDTAEEDKEQNLIVKQKFKKLKREIYKNL